MLVTLPGIEMLVRAVPSNVPSPMMETLPGIVMLLRLEQL
jgi:hypothetical protein